MRTNAYFLAFCAVLATGLGGCSAPPDDGPLIGQKPVTPAKLLDGVDNLLIQTTRLGELGELIGDQLTVRCGGCVGEEKPNLAAPAPAKPCPPNECTDEAKLQRGIAILQAALEAKKKGRKLNVTLPE